MKVLKDFNFSNKRVFVRCDFNVPVENGEVLDDFRIRNSLPTIKYLRERKARIILASHLGRPRDLKKKKERLAKCSLSPVRRKLEMFLGDKIKFSRDVVSRKTKREAKKLVPGEILLLENLRFEKGEEKDSQKFAKYLAKLADCYVGEAFGVSHRSHASTVVLPKLLPHFAGLQLEKEIEVLSRILETPRRPLIVIIGGKKVNSKIEVVGGFLNFADHLLLGGKVANTILRVKGINIGMGWPPQEIVRTIETISLTDPKIHLPVDVLCSPSEAGDVYIRETGPGNLRKDEEVFDIGKGTIEAFSKIIEMAGTIIWAGPLGVFENEKFARGTEAIARAVVGNLRAFKVAGGGETVRALREFNLLEDFSFVSTGGGAMLAFLSGEEMPGIKALE